MNILNTAKKIYFIGIGGIGVSALAKMMLHNGKEIKGTNDVESPKTLNSLRKEGVQIFLDKEISHIDSDTDIIIYSIAWDQSEKEFMEQVRSLDIPMFTYAEALGLISEDKYTVAVSGTHGKTTTTSMIAEILIKAERHPTVIVGSIMCKVESNFVAGEFAENTKDKIDNLFVVEACEYGRSFLNLHPSVLVITNIEEEHLDYYKDIEDIQNAFRKLVLKVPHDGFIVCNPNDPNVIPVLKEVLTEARPPSIIDYTKEDLSVSLSVLMGHNKQNARAALGAVRALGVPSALANQYLAKYSGTTRRQEYKGKTKNGVDVYDDYAHHPTEIKATLRGFRERFKKRNIIVVFQPHLYSRTKTFLNDFAKSFSDADEVIIADIYAAREINDGSIMAEDVVRIIKKYHSNVRYIGNLNEIKEYLAESLEENDILITMGAGDVYKVGEHTLGIEV